MSVERVRTPAVSGSPAAAASPSELVEDIRWMARAACARHGDPTLWDVDHDNHKILFVRCAKCAEALRICGGCPVRDLCAERARRSGDTDTLRGGQAHVSTVRCSQRQVVAAALCEHCTLPVLRGNYSGFCSVQCGRRAAAKVRAEQRVELRSGQQAAAVRVSIGSATIA